MGKRYMKIVGKRKENDVWERKSRKKMRKKSRKKEKKSEERGK